MMEKERFATNFTNWDEFSRKDMSGVEQPFIARPLRANSFQFVKFVAKHETGGMA